MPRIVAFPLSFVKDDAPGTPHAAPNASREFCMRVFVPGFALLEQATVGNSTIIVPAVVTPVVVLLDLGLDEPCPNLIEGRLDPLTA